MDLTWEGGFAIRVRHERDAVVVSANREGLVSLARHLQTLADEPSKSHFHLDEHNSLEDGSCELIIEKVEM
ncbi:MAG: hypothetical protein Q4C36_01720 [Coriobacteriia bacterium]|nr:hypothetical protein [Coriobacteriia bacterium]